MALTVAALAAVTAAGGTAISADPASRPLRDLADSSAFPVIGYAGSLVGEGQDARWFFETDPEGTADLFRETGARLVRQWHALQFWRVGAGGVLSTRNTTPRSTPMENVFRFYKANGIKVLLTLDIMGVYSNAAGQAALDGGGKRGSDTSIEALRREVREYVRWIVDGGYRECVAGFELGNEVYWQGASMFERNPDAPERYAERCEAVIPVIREAMPEAKIGIPLAEYFASDPDIAAVRARALAEGKIEGRGYFDASALNQWSGRFVVALSNQMLNVTHVIYHSYGAEVPYSASYSGILRYRKFSRAFPELAGKRFWITEWRERSDEDNRSHQRFREAQTKASYMMMMLAQDDVDALNLHEFSTLSGAMYVGWANARGAPLWHTQWNSVGDWRRDWKWHGHAHAEPGMVAPLFRLFTEAAITHSLVMDYGSLRHESTRARGDGGPSGAVWQGAKHYASYVERRRAVAAGRASVPATDDDCEWLLLMNKSRNSVAVLAVNTMDRPAEFTVEAAGMSLKSPTYRIYECPAEFLDAHEIPGEGRFTRQYAYEPHPVPPNPPNPRTISIPPHCIATVVIPMRKAPAPSNGGKTTGE